MQLLPVTHHKLLLIACFKHLNPSVNMCVYTYLFSSQSISVENKASFSMQNSKGKKYLNVPVYTSQLQFNTVRPHAVTLATILKTEMIPFFQYFIHLCTFLKMFICLLACFCFFNFQWPLLLLAMCVLHFLLFLCICNTTSEA